MLQHQNKFGSKILQHKPKMKFAAHYRNKGKKRSIIRSFTRETFDAFRNSIRAQRKFNYLSKKLLLWFISFVAPMKILSVCVIKVTYSPKARPYICVLNADKSLHSHFFCCGFLRKIHHYGFQTTWIYY